MMKDELRIMNAPKKQTEPSISRRNTYWLRRCANLLILNHGGRLNASCNVVTESGSAAINTIALERSGLFKSKA